MGQESMARSKSWLRRLCVISGLCVLTVSSWASFIDQGTIVIDRALNSPTLTVRYNGVKAATVELRVNGVSYSTRTVDPSLSDGETNFTLDLRAFTNAENEVEIRLFDKNGRFLGSQKSTISTEDTKSPVYLIGPKVGATVQGPVQIKVGFGKEMKNTYVCFFVDNHMKSMSNVPPFEYMWDTTRDSNGWHEVEAWVVDDSSNTYKTRKMRIFVNNPGGHTFRPMTQPPATQPKATPTAPKTEPITTPTVKPTTEPLTNLVPSANANTAAPSAAASGLKNAGAATAAAGTAVRASAVLAPNATAMISISNEVRPVTGASAGLKSGVLTSSQATGQQMMMPTGNRVVGLRANTTIPAIPKTTVVTKPETPATKPATPKVVTAAPVAKPKVEPLKTSPEPKAPVKATKPVETLPIPTAEVKAPVTQPSTTLAATKTVEPKMTTTAPTIKAPATVKLAGPIGKPPVKPVTPAATKPAVKPPLKSAVKPAAKASALMPITHGSKVANKSISVVYDNKPVNFDVQPSVQNGVPLTPFRHLFEKAGGKVEWQNTSKTVHANGQGREIYIQIGDKLAKVNNLPIELDLAPFLKNGRTIVPVSFLKDALNVNVEYDEKTGQVLITKITK